MPPGGGNDLKLNKFRVTTCRCFPVLPPCCITTPQNHRIEDHPREGRPAFGGGEKELEASVREASEMLRRCYIYVCPNISSPRTGWNGVKARNLTLLPTFAQTATNWHAKLPWQQCERRQRRPSHLKKPPRALLSSSVWRVVADDTSIFVFISFVDRSVSRGRILLAAGKDGE